MRRRGKTRRRRKRKRKKMGKCGKSRGVPRWWGPMHTHLGTHIAHPAPQPLMKHGHKPWSLSSMPGCPMMIA